MSHHHTKNTIGATAWCNVCGKVTIHSVSGKRIGHCTEHQPKEQPKKEEKLETLKLF